MPCVNITKHSLTQKCFINNLISNFLTYSERHILLETLTHKLRVHASAFYDIWIEKYLNVQINGRLSGN